MMSCYADVIIILVMMSLHYAYTITLLCHYVMLT